jgi:Tol biopolymer transport system component
MPLHANAATVVTGDAGIVYAYVNDSGASVIEQHDLTTSQSQTLLVPQPSPIYDLAVSPDESRVAFTLNFDVAVKPNGGPYIVLTSGGGDTDPVWTPDESTIVFTRHNALYQVPADGSGPAKPVLNGQDAAGPRISPDGRFVSFTDQSSSIYSVAIMDIDGSNRHDLGVRGGCASWSPDQTEIAFVNTDDAIELMHPDGTGAAVLPVTVPGQAGPTAGCPSWSSDGTTLYFTSPRANSGHAITDIWSINADGSDLTDLVSDPNADTVRSSWAYGPGTWPSTVPAPPNNASATDIDSSSVSLTWTAPSTPADTTMTGYQITAEPGGATATVDAGTTST